MINISRAQAISGWMETHDLVWLAEKAQTHERIVEVGCWMGRSTMCLADNTLGKVYAVDHWRGSIEHQPGLAKQSPEWLYDRFHENLEAHIESGKVIPVPLDSIAAAHRFAQVLQESHFDMVFIDGSHDYESIKADIEAWRPLVAAGGLLCGHDGGHPPIERAVREAFPEVRFECSMWVVDL